MSLFALIKQFGAPVVNRAVFNTVGACSQRLFSAKKSEAFVKTVDPETGETKKKKTSIIPKISLLVEGNLTVTTLEEAQKLSKRRDLKLVKITDLDAKTQRPVFKLMSGTEYLKEDLKHREQKKKQKENALIKGEKVLLLNSTISEHDLQTQVKKITKWIEKLFEVKVVVSGDSGKAENIYGILENSLKDNVRFVQKRSKGTDLKFQIIPPKKNDVNKNIHQNAPKAYDEKQAL